MSTPRNQVQDSTSGIPFLKAIKQLPKHALAILREGWKCSKRLRLAGKVARHRAKPEKRN